MGAPATLDVFVEGQQLATGLRKHAAPEVLELLLNPPSAPCFCAELIVRQGDRRIKFPLTEADRAHLVDLLHRMR